MALKQLMINKKLEQRKASMAELLSQEEALQTRKDQAASSLEEAQTDEEIQAVDGEINEIEAEEEELDRKKSDLQSEITALEGELEQLNSKTPTNNPAPAAEPEQRSNQNQNQGGQTRMRDNKYETRAQMLDRLNQPEVRDFYAGIAKNVKEKRAITGTDQLIPLAVLNMIQTRIGDFSNLYREVDVVQLSGEARVIMDGAIPKAIWVEMCDPVQELAGAFSGTELDGYKVGGFIPVCNAILEDSMINLANYLENRLAMAIGKAIDDAILNGTEAGKQPTGIITVLNQSAWADQRVTSSGSLEDIVTNMGLIDDGDDGPAIGEVIAVMRRSLYYSRIASQTFLPTADGRLVIQTAASPRLPDGTRVVFSQYAPESGIVLGDFKKYLLAERAGITISASEHVRFIEDQTVFKGTARYDGKPTHPNYFVLITLTAPEAPEAPEDPEGA